MTDNETIEIARDLAKKLLEAQKDSPAKGIKLSIQYISESFDYPLILGV